MKVGDIVNMYFATPEPIVGLITNEGKEFDSWKVMYMSEWGLRTLEFPGFMLYPVECEE